MTVGSGVVSGVGTDVATVYHQLTQINRALRTRGGQGSLSAGVAAPCGPSRTTPRSGCRLSHNASR